MLSGKKIILGITGSIAAYKAAPLVRLLVKQNAEVKVITTAGARKFISDLTFATLSKQAVFSDLWEGSWTEHVHLGRSADLMVIAPVSANTLAKLSHGLCDNALTAVFLSATCPLMLAPAMDADMFSHPRTQENLAKLAAHGHSILYGEPGPHASMLEGEGRMAEPEDIYAHIVGHFHDRPLKGKNVLISAGPTRESIDPVRFITNHSSGKMGYALAREALRLGANVTLVSGPVDLHPPKEANTIPVSSAEDMFQAVTQHAPEQDLIIMAAAVADYTIAAPGKEKIKKKEGDLKLELARTKDILKFLGENKPKNQLLIGFALETHNEMEFARKKLASKNLNFIVLNSMQDKGAGFGHNTNKITILDKKGDVTRYDLKSKTEAARDIFNKIIEDLIHE